MNKTINPPKLTPPKVWSSRFAQQEEKRIQECDCDCGDCVCHACSDMDDPTWIDAGQSDIAHKIQTGAIQTVALNEDGYSAPHGAYWVLMPAGSSDLVVTEEPLGQFLASLRETGGATLSQCRSALAGWSEAEFEQVLAFLIARGILHSDQSAPPHSSPYTSGTLSAWLHLTDQCNLQCRYCYIPHKPLSMTAEIARAAVKAVFRSAQAHQFERVKFKYSGGEPTLNFDTLLAAQLEAEALAQETGLDLDTVMLTNGYRLLDEQIASLAEHRIRVMVSVDGLQLAHDLNRPAANLTASSYLHAMTSIDRLMEKGITPHISITLTRLNLASVPDLVQQLLERQLTFSLNFYRQPGNNTQTDPLACRPQELIQGVQAIYAIIEQNLPRFRIFDSLVDRASPSHARQFACGAGQQYLVIDCLGQIAKCQMEMDQPVTDIRAADPLGWMQASRSGVNNLPVEEKDCAACPWRFNCAGGCPRVTQQQAGRYTARSPLCSVYQQLLPAAIQLEAERLIRYCQPVTFENPLVH